MTRFFDPISVSAVHIYHSALELSPRSSIVRELYYQKRYTSFQRVVVGIADEWDETAYLCNTHNSGSYTWSPCGRFVAALSNSGVQIRDAFSSELVSTLTEFDGAIDRGLAYSPDGRSLACLSDTLRIWDIQTGGAAKEIRYDRCYNGSVVWSSDGKTIGMIEGSNVHVYDLASGTTRSLGVLQSHGEPYLWAHDRSIRVMAMRRDPNGQDCTTEIFEVGSDLTRIESFHIRSPGHCRIGSFSPTTYRISVYDDDRFCILDLRNSMQKNEERRGIRKPAFLLEEWEFSESHCFSPDGRLFAASKPPSGVHVWEYDSHYSRYVSYMSISIRDWSTTPSLRFSPTSSLMLCHSGSLIQLYHLCAHPIDFNTPNSAPLVILSPCGSYIATTRLGGHSIEITNLLSQTNSQSIDTDLGINWLAITGNVLMVLLTNGVITAWRLTEGGQVDGVFGDGTSDQGDSIWTVLSGDLPKFRVNDQAVVIVSEGAPIHAYHAGTGEALGLAQANTSGHLYTPADMSLGRHYPHYRKADEHNPLYEDGWPVPLVAPQVEWVKDPEGKHRLWVPVEWRMDQAGWIHDIKALWYHHLDAPLIIMF